MTLHLDVTAWTDDLHWQWRLHDSADRVLASATVTLDDTEPEYGGFVDLRTYLRARAASDRRADSEAALVRRVSRWIGNAVLARIGPALVEAATDHGSVVRLGVPSDAAVLLERPLELAEVAGRTLSEHGIVLVRTVSHPVPGSPRPAGTAPAGDPVRILAAFSLPVDADPLALRAERIRLTEAVDAARDSGAAVDLLVLQYGVTRAALATALADPSGWDVVHYAGHGVAGVLTLEDEAGGTDPVDADAFAELLQPTADRVKLVVLSACESGAEVVADALDSLGADPSDAPADSDESRPGRLPGLARTIARRFDCAVLAMRYPVSDRFGVAFTAALYLGLLRDGAPVPVAFGDAMSGAVSSGMALDAASPSLFGVVAAELRLAVPVMDLDVAEREAPSSPTLPAAAETLVGRVTTLARAVDALTPGSDHRGVVFLGPPGTGKTACALEAAHLTRSWFDRVEWYEVPDDADRAAELLDRLEAAPHYDRGRTLTVIDAADPPWGSAEVARWQRLLTGRSDGTDRLIVTAWYTSPALPAGLLAEPLPPLSWAESVLLARDQPIVGPVLRGERAGLSPSVRDGVLRLLRLADGTPALLRRLDAFAGHEEFPGLLGEADPWGDDALVIEMIRHDEAVGAYMTDLVAWLQELLPRLTRAENGTLVFLCAVEESDRRSDVLESVWPEAAALITEDSTSPGLADLARRLRALGVLDVVEPTDPGDPETYRIPPVVSWALRVEVDPAARRIYDELLARFWIEQAEGATRDEEQGLSYLVRDAGVSGARYLARLGEYAGAAGALHNAFQRGVRGADEAGTFLRLLDSLYQRARGTDGENTVVIAIASVLQRAPTDEAVPRFESLLAAPLSPDVLGEIADKYHSLLIHRGRYPAAQAVFDRYLADEASSSSSEWRRLDLEVIRLEGLVHTAAGPELVETTRELLDRFDDLRSRPDPGYNPWNILERLLDAGRRAAKDIEDWPTAMDFNGRRVASKQRRGASPAEIAGVRGNDVAPLIALGRLDEAERLIVEIKGVFEEYDLHAEVGEMLSDLGAVELNRRRYASARDLEVEALRHKYLEPRPEELAVSHFNFGFFAHLAGDDAVGLAHSLAAVCLSVAIGSSRLAGMVERLAMLVAGYPGETPAPLPRDEDELINVVQALPGVRYATVLASLPEGRSAYEIAVGSLDGPIRTARRDARQRADELLPIAELANVAQTDPDAAQAFDVMVTVLEYFTSFRDLGVALRRLLTDDPPRPITIGTFGSDRLVVLDVIERCRRRPRRLRKRAMASLIGRLDELLGGQVTQFANRIAGFNRLAVLAALSSDADQQARPLLDAELARLGADDDWRRLVPRIRAALDGERGAHLLAGVDAIDRAVLRRIVGVLDRAGPALVRIPGTG